MPQQVVGLGLLSLGNQSDRLLTSNHMLTQRQSETLHNTGNTVRSRMTGGSCQNSHISMKSKMSKIKVNSSDMDLKSHQQIVEIKDLKHLGLQRSH